MDDLISRQAILDELRKAENHAFNTYYKGLIKAHKIIADMPSAEKTGHWIEDEYEMEVRCSECGEENDECSKYCPNCGARMVEPQERIDKE